MADVEVAVSLPDRMRRSRGEVVVPRWALATLLLLPGATILAVVLWFRERELEWVPLLNDPADVYRFDPSTGLFSHVGVLVMTVSAAVCGFSWMVMRGAVVPQRVHFAIAMVSVLSALLAIDDLFMLHERVLRHAFGIPELAIFAAYGLLGMAILGCLRAEAVRVPFLPFWLAVALLVGMVAIDQLEKFVGTTTKVIFAEETAKLTGFVVWSGFWCGYCLHLLRDEVRRG
jgi:hypothetical protein